jgi:hypothetical protein
MKYKVAIYAESIMSSLFLGSAKVNPIKFTNFLNELANDGWEVVTIERETRRALLFFSREEFVIILKKV